MKELFNYCSVPGHEGDAFQNKKELQQSIESLNMDGVELFVYQNEPYLRSYQDIAVGAHLNYWPMWLDFYNGNEEELKKFFADEDDAVHYYGSSHCEGWLQYVQENIRAALKEQPEYLVWHVSEATNEECFTFRFKQDDKTVLKAAAEVFNRVSSVIPKDTIVLFENLWWPGLRLTDKKMVEYFFGMIDHKNVGIMLDTGHLLNTNPKLKTEQDGVDYILETVRALGETASLIRGIHLSCSLSGEYVENFDRTYRQTKTPEQIFRHIGSIDQHRPFTDPAIRKVIELVQPEYLVHEFIYTDKADFERKIMTQLKACRKE